MRNRNLSGNVRLPLRLDIRRRPLWVQADIETLWPVHYFGGRCQQEKVNQLFNRRPSNTVRTDCTHGESRSLRTSSRRAFFQSDHL